MGLGELPLWGQWSLFGLSLGFNFFFITLYIRGILVSRAQLDQVQKLADTFQAAWAQDQETKHEAIALTALLTTTATTMEKVLNALPQAESARVIITRHDESS
jgi:hypothetical protein